MKHGSCPAKWDRTFHLAAAGWNKEGEDALPVRTGIFIGMRAKYDKGANSCAEK